MTELTKGRPSVKLKYPNVEEFLRAQGLSPCELRVALQILQGKSNRDIGETLHITEKTVKFHVSNISKVMRLKHKQPRVSLILTCVPYLAEIITEENCHQFRYSEDALPPGYYASARESVQNRVQTCPSTSQSLPSAASSHTKSPSRPS